MPLSFKLFYFIFVNIFYFNRYYHRLQKRFADSWFRRRFS